MRNWLSDRILARHRETLLDLQKAEGEAAKRGKLSQQGTLLPRRWKTKAIVTFWVLVVLGTALIWSFLRGAH
jgi:hypothetical protein